MTQLSLEMAGFSNLPSVCPYLSCSGLGRAWPWVTEATVHLRTALICRQHSLELGTPSAEGVSRGHVSNSVTGHFDETQCRD